MAKKRKNKQIPELLKEVENLKQEIKQLKSRKRYGLVWEEKPERVVEICKEKLPVLAENTGKEIKTDNGKPTNILINKREILWQRRNKSN